MENINLYHADYSTCSQKVRLALAEKNIPYTEVRINFRKEEQLKPEYLQINPNGVVPTLVHNNDVITDSSCILEYLEDVFTDVSLSPEQAIERAKMRSWLRYMEEVPTKAIRIPSFENIFLPTLRIIKSKRSFDKLTSKRTIRRGFYAKMNRGQGFTDSDIHDSIYQLRDTVLRINSALDNNQWIMGENLSLVDISLLPLIDRAEDLGMNFLWNDLPAVKNWLSRLQTRPSFKTAFYKGSRLSERLEFKIAVKRSRKRNETLTLDHYLKQT